MSSRLYPCLVVRLALLGPAALLVLSGPAAADDDAGPLLAFVQTAVANGRVEESRILGFNNPNKQFTETPDEAGVLVGLDIGVGKFFDMETVYAFRTLYRTRHGDLRLQDHGLFRDKRLPSGKIQKSKVLHTVHVQAKPGYAVGGVTLRSGLLINGLSLTFMKIDGSTLDPLQSYTSDWVGDRTGGSEASIDGNGAPVVGVFGSQDDEHASALGLLYASPPAAAVAPPAEPRPAVPPPVPPPPPAAFHPPAVPAEAPRPVEPPPEAKADLPPAEPAAAPQKPAAVPAPAAETGLPMWATAAIPLAIFGAVAGVIYLVTLLPFGRKAEEAGRVGEKRDRARGRPAAPVSPSALSRGSGPRKRRAVEKEEVLELREEDVISLPDEEPLLDALPAESPHEEARAAVANALPADAKWPRLEL